VVQGGMVEVRSGREAAGRYAQLRTRGISAKSDVSCEMRSVRVCFITVFRCTVSYLQENGDFTSNFLGNYERRL
jgi:hypothetical protein